MTDFELPAEAQALIERVAALEAQARASEEFFSRALERVRAGIDVETQRLAAEAERQQARLRSATAAQRAELTRMQRETERDREAFETLLRNPARGSEFVARAWSDYEKARAEATAEALEDKGRPALIAAEAVRQLGRDRAEAIRRAKLAEWILELYEWHFPWLSELRDLEVERSFVASEDASEETENGRDADPAKRWLSEQEFRALPEVERNQRALDRYLRSRKSPWQLGRDYERYIGYLRESEGAHVKYQGIFAGLEDLGRDLLAEKDEHIEVIQCKRWSKHKTIHEKHVFQLFGTVVAARIEFPEHRVTGTFVTTTGLSERAHEFAHQLDIQVVERFPLKDYPLIKCNVGRGGKRIYHLPFDQQYDTTVIAPARGETWVATAAEAEALGFRRAWRWRSAKAVT